MARRRSSETKRRDLKAAPILYYLLQFAAPLGIKGVTEGMNNEWKRLPALSPNGLWVVTWPELRNEGVDAGYELIALRCVHFGHAGHQFFVAPAISFRDFSFLGFGSFRLSRFFDLPITLVAADAGKMDEKAGKQTRQNCGG